MPALQVRDFPDELYAKLKESAAADHRSIAQQTIVAVEHFLGAQAQQGTPAKAATAARRQTLFEQIDKLIPQQASDSDEILRMIAAGRSKRDESIERALDGVES